MKKLILILALLPLMFFGQLESSTCNASKQLTEDGANFADANKWDEAIKRYTLAIQYCPENALAFHNRAIAKYHYKDYKGSSEDYLQALKLNTNDNSTNADACYGLGLCYFNLSNKQMYCASFSKAGELGHAKAYEALNKYCK